MGTLFVQPPRKHHQIDLEYQLQRNIDLAKKYKCSLADVLYCERNAILDRTNTVCDIKDEQLIGLGNC